MYTFIFFSGANSIWHGFIDIVFTSPYQSTPESTSDDVPAIAKAAMGEEEMFESLDESKGKCGYFERLEHIKTIHHKRH